MRCFGHSSPIVVLCYHWNRKESSEPIAQKVVEGVILCMFARPLYLVCAGSQINLQLRRDYKWIQMPIRRQRPCILTTGVDSDSPVLAVTEHCGPSDLRAVFHDL